MPLPLPNPKQLGRYFAMAQVGLEMVAPIVLGWWLDSRFGTAPWLLVVGVVVGFVFGLYHLVTLANRKDEELPAEQKPGDETLPEDKP